MLWEISNDRNDFLPREETFLFGMEYRNFSAFYIPPFWEYTGLVNRKKPTEEEINMVIEKSAIAGTLESSDAQVTVEPCDELQISIQSSVLNQYGDQIQTVVGETLERLAVKEGKIIVIDKGALDCTLRARVECAVFRSCGSSSENIPWGGVVCE